MINPIEKMARRNGEILTFCDCVNNRKLRFKIIPGYDQYDKLNTIFVYLGFIRLDSFERTEKILGKGILWNLLNSIYILGHFNAKVRDERSFLHVCFSN